MKISKTLAVLAAGGAVVLSCSVFADGADTSFLMKDHAAGVPGGGNIHGKNLSPSQIMKLNTDGVKKDAKGNWLNDGPGLGSVLLFTGGQNFNDLKKCSTTDHGICLGLGKDVVRTVPSS